MQLLALTMFSWLFSLKPIAALLLVNKIHYKRMLIGMISIFCFYKILFSFFVALNFNLLFSKFYYLSIWQSIMQWFIETSIYTCSPHIMLLFSTCYMFIWNVMGVWKPKKQQCASPSKFVKTKFEPRLVCIGPCPRQVQSCLNVTSRRQTKINSSKLIN